MAQTLTRAPLTTVVYTQGKTEGDRRRKWDLALRSAHDHAREYWLNTSAGGIDETIDNVATHMEDTEPGDAVTWEEQSPDEPLGQLLVAHDYNGSRDGLRTVGEWVRDQDRAVTFVVPNADHLVDKINGTEWLDYFLRCDCDVHFAESCVTICRNTPTDGKTKRVVRTLAESISGSVKSGDSYQHIGGRPPIGFKAEDGQLVPDRDGDPSYERVCTVLQQAQDGHVSDRKAASKLGCARATVRNAINDRPGMYGLDQ